MNIKSKIELLWCFLGGFSFTVFARILENGSSASSFSWKRDIFKFGEWINLYHSEIYKVNLGNFIFGFIVTYLIIWSVKIYKKS
ncbi:hypothetical protein N9O69_05905 [Alphaproteobacteria bacterium]|nr:hypothetical protein [Alphaproteobacteria bacterium]